MLSASSGVRISSKSEKSEIDKSSIVTFRPRDVVDELSVEVAASIDVSPTRWGTSDVRMAPQCAVLADVFASLALTRCSSKHQCSVLPMAN